MTFYTYLCAGLSAAEGIPERFIFLVNEQAVVNQSDLKVTSKLPRRELRVTSKSPQCDADAVVGDAEPGCAGWFLLKQGVLIWFFMNQGVLAGF